MIAFALLVFIYLQIYLIRMLVVVGLGMVILVVRLVPLSSIRLMNILIRVYKQIIVFYCDRRAA